MAPEKRQQDTPLERRLFRQCQGFSFFQAVRLLESLFPDKEKLGEALLPEQEPVRFKVKPGFDFPPSDIVRLDAAEDGGPAEMEVAFMGLIGPAGVLPHWYNELVLERNRKRDHSLNEFLDLFHHRLISSFYLAWKKNAFAVNFEPGARDRLSGYLLCLLGVASVEGTLPLGLAVEPLVFFSGLLGRTVPSATGIEATVSYFADCPAAVEQFIERLLPIAAEERTRLGRRNARLGVDAVCGSHFWEAQSKFRVNLGPLAYAEFVQLLPSGTRLRPLFSLVRFMAGVEYECEMALVLKRHEVPPCVLGDRSARAPRLGWTTWVSTPGVRPKTDPKVVFQLEDVSPG